MAALPPIPGLSAAVSAVSGQARALAGLPRTLIDLNRSVLGLIEALSTARDTMAALAVVTARLERVAEELEEPVIALRPGIERLARVLDNEAVDTLPETIRRINEDVLPLIAGLRETQNRVNSIATVLPGASLLFQRRPRSPGGRPNGGQRGPVTEGTVIEPEE